jgi:hypothetical protein
VLKAPFEDLDIGHAQYESDFALPNQDVPLAVNDSGQIAKFCGGSHGI